MNSIDSSLDAFGKAELFPSLTEKLVVDFANGIDIIDDHLRVKEARKGYFARICDSALGISRERDIEIHRNSAQGHLAALRWLTDLTNSHARSNLAIAAVRRTINNLSSRLTEVANSLADLSDEVVQLEIVVERRIGELDVRLDRVEALKHVDLVCAKLEGGQYSHLPLLPGVYATLDELYWGALGDFLREGTVGARGEVRQYLNDKLMAVVGSKAGKERRPAEAWMRPAPEGGEYKERIAYIGDWSTETGQPFSFVATQPLTVLPLAFPLRLSAPRVVNAMLTEMFEERNA